MLRTSAILVAIVAVASIAACSAPPGGSEDPFAVAPPDLTIDLTILERPTFASTGEPAPTREAHQRPSRYILFADGSLCYGPDLDHKLGVEWVPPTARILTRQQVADLWSLAQQIGFANPNAADPTVNFKLVMPTRGERIYLLEFHGSQRRWNFIRRVPTDRPDAMDPALAKFIQHLAALAWVDQPDSPVMYMPKRYDFGPDPYAQYRNRNAEQ